MTVRFDAYTATTSSVKADQAIAWLFQPGDTMQEGRGFHTFGHRVSVKDDSGEEVGYVAYGGRQGDRIMVEVKGIRTPEVVERLRASAEHRCTRVDSCVDFERPGVFEELLGPVMEVKHAFKLYGPRDGDWEMPELGRTQYLGAPSSAIRARLYEKGKQPQLRHLCRDNLVRLEVQVRPQKDAKTAFSSLSALDVWGASKWTRELAARVLEQHLDSHPPGTIRKDSKRDEALRWMVKQYGSHLVSLAADLGGWDCVGLTLSEMIKDGRSKRRL